MVKLLIKGSQVQIFKRMNQLSPDYGIFEKAIAIFRPSRIVINKAMCLFNQYTLQNDVSAELMPIFAEIAVFIAESSQQLRDLKGRRISGIGLTFTRFISNSTSIPQAIQLLYKFIQSANLDSFYKSQIEEYLEKANKTIQLMKKFQKYITFFQFIQIEKSEGGKYKDIFTELAWMLFIDCKQNYFRQQSVGFEDENILASVFYFMIRYSLDYISPKRLIAERSSQKRAIISKILHMIIEVFQIENIQAYKLVAEYFDEYAQVLINNLVFRTVGTDTDFFSPFIIYFNYKQLQNRYQKSLQPKDIDFRILRKQKSLTPINKEALFYRVQVKKHNTLSRSMSRQYKSHRMLNYDDSQIKENGHTSQILKKQRHECNPEIVIKRRNMQQKSNQYSASLRSNKSNKNLEVHNQNLNNELYRYINSLSKPGNRRSQRQFNIMREGQEQKENIISNKQIDSRLNHHFVFDLLKQKMSEDYTINEKTLTCLEALSQFIFDQMKIEEEGRKIIEYFGEIQAELLIELWYCLDYFLQKDEKLIPYLIRVYEKQQQDILTSLVWKQVSFIDEVAELAANYQKPKIFVKFCDKLVTYCQLFIIKICKQIKLSKEHITSAYNCMKFILSANGNLLQNRHIDQILMCSIYIAGKTLGATTLFTNIKQAYESINRRKSDKFEEIFNQVTISQEEVKDIIYFYNVYFIDSVKPFVPYMSNPSLSLLHPIFQREIEFITSESQQILIQNRINLQETAKPKVLRLKNNRVQGQKEGIGIFIHSQRNQTRVRIRPHNVENSQLCATQRIKAIQQERIINRSRQL